MLFLQQPQQFASQFTIIGKIIILVLIQLGGWGVMTFSLGLVFLLGKNLSLKWRYALEGLYNDTDGIPILGILIRVIKFTLLIEGITALFLFFQFRKYFSFWPAVGHSVFQAVSAFCNAGFSTFSDNLISFRDNPIILISVAIAIIFGGIGFVVLKELSRLRFLISKKHEAFSGFSIYTKIVLIVTIILLFLGTVAFFFLEKENTLQHFGTGQAIVNSFFQSATARTAGFNSINIASLKQSTLLMIMSLMFIGGAPGSMAGGIKITTISVVLLLIYSKFKGKEEISLFNRSIDEDTVNRSLTLFVLALLFIPLVTFLLLMIHESTQNHSFLQIMFETISAYGTVGLSTGITAQLSLIEKIIIMGVMLIGRIGLLSIVTAFFLKKKAISAGYPREMIMIG